LSMPSKSSTRIGFETIERELRKRDFGVLGTISPEGHPHSTGVLYAVSERTKPLQIYIISRTRNRKVRNIAANPNVSFVVPLARRLLAIVPPNCIQFQGVAKILEAANESAVKVYQSSWFLRLVSKIESDIVSTRGGEACFIRISPAPIIFTYGVGLLPWELLGHAADAAARVEIPRERLPTD